MKEEITMPPQASGEVVFIYILTEPNGKTVRYVGQTIDPQRRLRSHLFPGASGRFGVGPQKTKWILDLRKKKLMPRMFVIEVVPAGEELETEQKWIDFYNSDGRQTLNGLDKTIDRRRPPGQSFVWPSANRALPPRG